MTATIHAESADVLAMPVRQAVNRGPVAVGQVLAEVVPMAAFRQPAFSQASGTEPARRLAALRAIGAWRRANPDAPFELDLAAAERISREFGL